MVNIGSFSLLQEKLDRWLEDYHVNSCDQNVSRCCEAIEQNARLQTQLFKILSLTAGEGGVYGGASVLKSRLLPMLSQGLLAPSGLTADILTEVASKDREINEVQDMYERSLQTLEDDLTNTRAEADDLKNELDETRGELSSIKRVSTSDKMFTEAEVRELRAKLRLAEEELSTTKNRANLVDTYERQLRRLREDVAVLTGRRDVLLNGSTLLAPVKDYSSLPRPTSPLAPEDVTQRVRQQSLITRFNDMFAQDRLDALDTLRRYSDDYENNQRIIFSAIQEAFTSAKLSFANFKMKVRSNLAVTHLGPETLEEAVQDYVNRNTDLYDLPGLVSDVVRALNRKSYIFLPPDVSYNVISPFLREACKLAWNMSALAHPLDVAVANDAELHDENKYRRSYDSDYSAPLVNHHIWPCLMQGLRVVMKGEACTRRGASLSRSRSPSRSASPTRAMSPVRSLSRGRSPTRARSRSPSPSRLRARSISPGSSRVRFH